jgi:hypothetical protein
LGNNNNVLIIEPTTPTISTSDSTPNTKLVQGDERLKGEEEVAPNDKLTSPKVPFDTMGDDVDDIELDSPLLPHETKLGTWGPNQDDNRARRTSIGVKISRMNTFIPPEPTEDDLKDPNLEVFPHGKPEILMRIQTLKKELPIDDTSQVIEETDLEPEDTAHTLDERSSSSLLPKRYSNSSTYLTRK